jgi:hypothetical protein
MESRPNPDPFICTAALIKDVQAKIVEALDCQTNAYLLTWGCALVAVQMPLDGDADFPDRPDSLLAPTMSSPIPPMLQGELSLELSETKPADAPEWLWEPEGPVAPAPAPPLEGADADTAEHGFLVITYGGECFWLTPAHLTPLIEAGPLVFGRVDWHATLGFRSSPAPYTPLVDLNVECTAKPSLSVSGKRPQYGWSQYVHAKRHHQDLVLLTSAKPAGFPW